MSNALASFPENPNRKELFLDTRGACFLCLTESSKDTKEICLRNICRFFNIDPHSILLKELKETLSEEKPSPKINNCDFSVLLCSICSSLTANLSDMIRQMEVIKMLTTHQLQVFHQIINASNHEPRSTKLWEQLKQKIIEFSNPIEARLVESLRQEATIKCSQQVKRMMSSRYPNIVLQKVEETVEKFGSSLGGNRKSTCKIENDHEVGEILDNQTATLIAEEKSRVKTHPYISKKWICKKSEGGCGRKFSTKANLKIHTVGHCPNTKYKSPESSPTKLQEFSLCRKNKECPKISEDQLLPESENSHQAIFEKYCGSEKTPTRNGSKHNYSCLICKDFKETNRRKVVHSHLASVHPEKFFSEKKLPEISQDEFRLCCKNVLHSEAKNTLNTKNIYQRPATCTYCGVEKRNLQNMRYHLMLKHHNILVKKVVNDQEKIKSSNKNQNVLPVTPLVDENSETGKSSSKKQTQKSFDVASPEIAEIFAKYSEIVRKAPKGTFSTYRCTLCPTSGSKRVIQVHLVNTHTEIIFANQLLPSYPAELFRSCCRKIISNETRQKTEDMTSLRGVSCYICGIRKCDNHNLKYHMVLQHYDIVGGKIKNFQKMLKLINREFERAEGILKSRTSNQKFNLRIII